MDEISKQTVKKIAGIARLNLTEKEADKYAKDLESILEAFKKLDQVDTEKTRPTFHPIEVKNVFRKDEVKPGLTKEDALANTKHKEKGYFKGPRVV